MRGVSPGGAADGLAWTTRDAAAGANGLGLPVLVDGLNERGLGGGKFCFRDFAAFEAVPDDARDRALAPRQLVTGALTRSATVEEPTAARPDVLVGNAELAALGGVPPVHAVFADAGGAAVVVEHVGGRRTAYDAPLGVATNAPPSIGTRSTRPTTRTSPAGPAAAAASTASASTRPPPAATCSGCPAISRRRRASCGRRPFPR